MGFKRSKPLAQRIGLFTLHDADRALETDVILSGFGGIAERLAITFQARRFHLREKGFRPIEVNLLQPDGFRVAQAFDLSGYGNAPAQAGNRPSGERNPRQFPHLGSPRIDLVAGSYVASVTRVFAKF